MEFGPRRCALVEPTLFIDNGKGCKSLLYSPSDQGMDSVLNSPVSSTMSTDVTCSSSRQSLLSRIASPNRQCALKSVFFQFTCFPKETMAVADLGMALKFIGHHMSAKELEKLIEETDEDGGGTVDLDEWSTAAERLDLKAMSSGDSAEDRTKILRRIWSARARSTADGMSMATKHLVGALALAGHRLTEAEADALVLEFDEDGSGELDFDEFQQMVGKLDSEASLPF